MGEIGCVCPESSLTTRQSRETERTETTRIGIKEMLGGEMADASLDWGRVKWDAESTGKGVRESACERHGEAVCVVGKRGGCRLTARAVR